MESRPDQPGGHGAEGDPAAIQVLRYQFPLDRTSGSADPAGSPCELIRHLELLDRWGCTLITFTDYRLFLKGELHLPRRPVILTFDGEAHLVHRAVLPVLRNDGTRVVLFASLEDAHTRHAAGRGPDTGTTDVTTLLVDLHEAGCEIGALPGPGIPLTLLPADAVERELVHARRSLEDVLGTRVLSLAYPGGKTGPGVKRMVREAGYDFAVTGAQGWNAFGSDPMEIHRHTIDAGTSVLALAAKALIPRLRYAWLRHRSIARPGFASGIRDVRTRP